MHPAALILLLIPPAALRPAVPSQSAVLEIAVEDDADPWSRHDGTGFANDVVKAAFQAQGVRIEMLVMPYARCKERVLQGKVAACLSMARSPELNGKVMFGDEPLFVCDADYFVALSRAAKVKQAGRLPRGSRVGVVAGYEYPASIYRLSARGWLILEESDSEESNLKKLAKGRLDAALIDNNEVKSAKRLLERAQVSGLVARAFSAGPLPCYIGFSRGHAQGGWARRQFNLGMRRISAQGRLKAIEKLWAETPPSLPARPEGQF